MRPLGGLIDEVADLIRVVTASVIEPRFAALRDEDVFEKSPGELVTVADQEAEAALAAGLASLLPGVPVVGEEACAIDPERLRALDSRRVWLVDPLDGTANFAAGSSHWAVMIALVADQETVASWIWQPIARRMYVAERRRGARCNGAPLRIGPRADAAQELRGAVLSRFFDPPTAATVDRNRKRFGAITAGRMCSGVEYPELIDDVQDFILFWRTLPWDHAPGALLVEEAGGVARRPDGTPYRPGTTGSGLLVAANARVWSAARTILE